MGNKKSRTPEVIKNLTDFQLREAIRSLQNTTWDENALLRVLATKIHGDDNVVSMLSLAVPLAVELEERTSKNIKHTSDLLLETLQLQKNHHSEQEENKASVKNYHDALYHNHKAGAIDDILIWIKLNSK
jgi:hypothetical protein